MNFLKAIGFFLVALLFVLSAVFLSKWITTEDTPQGVEVAVPVTRQIVSCPQDRLSYSVVDKSIGLISKKTVMFASNGEFINPQIVVTKSETEDSKVACGYVFVRAGTETNGALQSWEDIYINPNTFGGHIVSQNAISVNDGENFSEYIFSLDRIPYWPTTARKVVLSADWASLLNVSNQVKFDIALNTNDRTGFIDELKIAYKCWNPKTGEENTGCKLEILSKEDQQSTTPIK